MSERRRKVVQVHSVRTYRKEDGKMLIDFHVLSRLECGHDVNGYGPQERACPECGREATRAESSATP